MLPLLFLILVAVSFTFLFGGNDAEAETPVFATSCEEFTHWKRLWCWEGLGAGGEGDDRGWDGWMASLTRWTWVWVNSESWWGTGRPGVLQFMGSRRVGHDWATELNWTVIKLALYKFYYLHKEPVFGFIDCLYFSVFLLFDFCSELSISFLLLDLICSYF